MPETISQEQKRSKPKLEEFIATHLSAEWQQDALAFLDYCKAKKISYPWSSTNTWTLKAKGKSIGLIWIGGDKWVDGRWVSDNLDDGSGWTVGVSYLELLHYPDFIEKEKLQSLFLTSLKRCSKCGSGCPPYTIKMLGKEYNGICRSRYLDRDTCIRFKNPDVKALQIVQRIIDFKLAIPHGTKNRPIFDPSTEGMTRLDNKLRICGITDLQGNSFPGRPGEKMDYLFDGQYDSYARFAAFLFGDEPKHSYDVVFQLDAPVELKMYSLVTGFHPFVPDKWTLYGAASGDGPWMRLDSRNEFPKPVTEFTEKAFAIACPGAYRFYRFTFMGQNFILSQVHLYT